MGWHKFGVRATISLPKTYIAMFSTNTRNYAHILNAAQGTAFVNLVVRGTNSRVEATTCSALEITTSCLSINEKQTK